MFRTWLATRSCSWLPSWFQQWQHHARIAYLQHTVVPAMLDAQAIGVGLDEAWADPSTPPAEIVQWFTDHIAATPYPLAPSGDQFHLLIAHCTADEWTTAQADGIALASERIIIEWTGGRSTWWWDGYDTMTAALPTGHAGLYLATNALGTVLMTALTSSSAPAPAR